MNSRTTLLTVLIAGVFVIGSLASNEAFASGYLKIDDIKGESTEVGHEDSIEILSWSWGETQTASHTGGGGGAGKVSMQDFNFLMTYNSASPVIMESLAKGEHFGEAVLTLTANRGTAGEDETYLIITMKNVVVTSYQTGGSASGDPLPTEQVSLNFGTIKFEYIPENRDGSSGPSVIGEVSKKPGHR